MSRIGRTPAYPAGQAAFPNNSEINYVSATLATSSVWVLWLTRTGSLWRDLPTAFDPWNSIYLRFAGLADKNVWQKIFAGLRHNADFEEVFTDNTIVRAHQHAAGSAKKKG